jgi:hypothetical protein
LRMQEDKKGRPVGIPRDTALRRPTDGWRTRITRTGGIALQEENSEAHDQPPDYQEAGRRIPNPWQGNHFSTFKRADPSGASGCTLNKHRTCARSKEPNRTRTRECATPMGRPGPPLVGPGCLCSLPAARSIAGKPIERPGTWWVRVRRRREDRGHNVSSHHRAHLLGSGRLEGSIKVPALSKEASRLPCASSSRPENPAAICTPPI